MISVILNAYKRQHVLNAQIKNVLEQSKPAERVLIWNNGTHLNIKNFEDKVVVANSSENLGVWSRFAFALNADTEYVCVLDDDTFPSNRFFESCLEQMRRKPALLGCRGLRFLSHSRYHPFQSFGWDCPNENAEVVDIVGHAWFFKREWLSIFWREQPKAGVSRLVGEDMHFSYTLQKYLNIETVVPAHPKNDISIWGSNPEMALELGTSKEAISQKESALRKFDEALKSYTSSGFKLYKDQHKLPENGYVIGPGLSRSKLIKNLASKYPKFGSFSRKIQKKLIDFKIHI